MKPRTKLQFEVLEHSYYLPSIKNKMLNWAANDCMKHLGYATKNLVICLDCGQKFPTELVSRKKAVCPHCKTKLEIKQTLDRTLKQNIYVAIADVYKGFQVVRCFQLISYHKADSPAKLYFNEILQHWIQPSGKREVIGRNHNLNWNTDSWTGDMEIRNKIKEYKFDVQHDRIHPDSKFQEQYTKIGINSNLQGITVYEATKHIPGNSYAETLLKAKQYSLLNTLVDRSAPISYRWPSIKICLRNKYFVKDAKIWFDYLDLLSYFNKDLRNAHYVCPKDLNKAHDKLVVKKREIQNKQAIEKKREKQIKDEARFQELKAQFFGIVFSDELIKVKVLESVAEFMEEGDKMHHCVFTNEYYLKPDSLVFSATIAGERIETVEVSIEQMKVVQSRGLLNKSTEYHDRIVDLVNKNIKKIKVDRQKESA
jgi:DNA-directed RNA polymerase subunit RPC12/RpoP